MAVKYKTTAENQKLSEALAMSGLRDSEIADLIGCAESTLKKYYATELSRGRKIANAKVVTALFNNAMKGNVAAQIFWCKARLGWRETPENGSSDQTPPPKPTYFELSRNAPTPPEFPDEGVH